MDKLPIDLELLIAGYVHRDVYGLVMLELRDVTKGLNGNFYMMNIHRCSRCCRIRHMNIDQDQCCVACVFGL